MGVQSFHQARRNDVHTVGAVQPDGHHDVFVDESEFVIVACFAHIAVFPHVGQHVVPHDGRFAQREDLFRQTVDEFNGDASAAFAAGPAFRALAQAPHFVAAQVQVPAVRVQARCFLDQRGRQLKRAFPKRTHLAGSLRQFAQMLVLRQLERILQMAEALLQRDHIDKMVVGRFQKQRMLLRRQSIQRMTEFLPAAGQLIFVFDHQRVQLIPGHFLHIFQKILELWKQAAHIQIIAAHRQFRPVVDLHRGMLRHFQILAQRLYTVKQPRRIMSGKLNGGAAHIQ